MFDPEKGTRVSEQVTRVEYHLGTALKLRDAAQCSDFPRSTGLSQGRSS